MVSSPVPEHVEYLTGEDDTSESQVDGREV
jgi:hypothetical protein